MQAIANSTLDGAPNDPKPGLANTAASTALAQTSFDVATLAETKADQSIATIVGAPTIASVDKILADNSNIESAFSSTAATYFASGEIGGSYDTKGADAEVQSQTINFTINPSLLTTQGDLLLGLYNGTAPTNLTGFTFNVSVNGTGVQLPGGVTPTSETAQALFTNDLLDFGSLSSFEGSNGLVDLSITMTETFSGAGSFDGQFLLGDPPPKPASSSVQASEFTSALFDGFFGTSGMSTESRHATVEAPSNFSASADLLGTHRLD